MYGGGGVDGIASCSVKCIDGAYSGGGIPKTNSCLRAAVRVCGSRMVDGILSIRIPLVVDAAERVRVFGRMIL